MMFYLESKSECDLERKKVEWFSLKMDFHQRCVISLQVFNLFLDAVLRDVSTRVLEDGVDFPHAL